jgi:hypothetical protein
MKQTGKAQGSTAVATQDERTDDLNQETASQGSSKDQACEHLLQTFYAWLPKALHDAPLIDWTQIPSRTMVYLVKTVGDSPFAGPLALAAVTAAEPLGEYTLYRHISPVHTLLRHVHTLYGVQHVAELTKALWEDYATKVEVTAGIYQRWRLYSTFATRHLRGYLEQLTPQQYTHIEPYILPPLPLHFLKRVLTQRQNSNAEARVMFWLHCIRCSSHLSASENKRWNGCCMPIMQPLSM